jgi:hypothetical protein
MLALGLLNWERWRLVQRTQSAGEDMWWWWCVIVSGMPKNQSGQKEGSHRQHTCVELVQKDYNTVCNPYA